MLRRIKQITQYAAQHMPLPTPMRGLAMSIKRTRINRAVRGEVSLADIVEVGLWLGLAAGLVTSVQYWLSDVLPVHNAAGEVQIASTSLDASVAMNHLDNAEGMLKPHSGNPAWWGNPEANYDTIKATIDSEQAALQQVIDGGAKVGTQEYSQAYDPIQDSMKRLVPQINTAHDWQMNGSYIRGSLGLLSGCIAGLIRAVK